jgi:very-short-patch-repair endonuclease
MGMRITRNQSVSKEKLELARSLRRAMTSEERISWQALRTDKLANIHFRRQQVIAGFIVDFYCASACLALEIDGASPTGREEV